MEFFEQLEVCVSIKAVEDILRTDIFSEEMRNSVFVRSAFIDTLISLRALMYKTARYVKRIDFVDDVHIDGNVKDVTDLIKFVRDAVCHPDSDNHKVEGGNFSAFNVAYGITGIIKLGDNEQRGLYADDVYFMFGEQGIYLKRHMLRAFEQAKESLAPLIGDELKPILKL